MPTDLPDHYFRIRENGALVFRLDPDNPQRRLGMEQIATVNIRNGEIRPQGERALSDKDRVAIQTWIEERRATLAQREIDDILRLIERLNLATQWAQGRASDADLVRLTDALLLAMHDLRAVLVRRTADRLAGDRP